MAPGCLFGRPGVVLCPDMEKMGKVLMRRAVVWGFFLYL